MGKNGVDALRCVKGPRRPAESFIRCSDGGRVAVLGRELNAGGTWPEWRAKLPCLAGDSVLAALDQYQRSP